MSVIRLRVPAILSYRDVVTNMTIVAARLAPAIRGPVAARAGTPEFTEQIASAVAEAFANGVLHAYRDRGEGDLLVEIEPAVDRFVVRLFDWGRSFDPSKIDPPKLDELPESGMGLYIMRSFLDDVRYTAGTPGTPNVLELTKRYAP